MWSLRRHVDNINGFPNALWAPVTSQDHMYNPPKPGIYWDVYSRRGQGPRPGYDPYNITQYL